MNDKHQSIGTGTGTKPSITIDEFYKPGGICEQLELESAESQLTESRLTEMQPIKSQLKESESSLKMKTPNTDLELTTESKATFHDEQAMKFAESLDFSIVPRIDRAGTNEIKIHSKKNARLTERMIAIFTAIKWGFLERTSTWKMKQRIAMLACRQTAYDYGFKNTFSGRELITWYAKLNKSIEDGVILEQDKNPLGANYKGSVKYTDVIEKKYPGYLRTLFCYALKTLSKKSTLRDLTQLMNQKSATMTHQNKTAITLKRQQLSNWLKEQGGIEKIINEKPLETSELM